MILDKIFNPQRVLVVGGSGFIGSNLIRCIKMAGYKFKMANMDLKEGGDVLHGIRGKWDTIVLLAWDMSNKGASIEYNMDIVQSVGDYLSDHPETHLIFASTAAVYADNGAIHKEEENLGPINIYGTSKAMAESIFKQLSNPVTVFRFSNVYGPDGHGVINKFLEGGKKIYGDGEQVRDFVAIALVCQSVAKAIENPIDWMATFNISSGKGMTINEAFKLFGSGKPRYLKAKPNEIKHSILDNSRVKDNLWQSIKNTI